MAGATRTEGSARARWLAWAVLIVAVAWLYGPVLIRLAGDWRADESYSHGWLIAPIAAGLAWRDRTRLRLAPRQPSALGLVIVIGSLAMFAAGMIGAELFTTRASLIGVVAGTIVFLWGWQHFRLLWFPLAYLILMIPLPAIVFDRLTESLQLVASGLGEHLLRTADVPVFREGNVLTMSTITLGVTDACSGIRSLMSLVAVSSLVAYVYEPTLARRVIIAVSAVPLAVALNGMRVAVTGVAASRFGPDLARGMVHEASGWVIFVFALAGLWMLHRTLEWSEGHR